MAVTRRRECGHNGAVRTLPAGLPAATSEKWHSRRGWDPAGHLRVRSLSNPHWRQDMPWLIGWLRHRRPAIDHPMRGPYDEAIHAATRYPRTRCGALDAELAWDELLAAFDEVSRLDHELHLAGVRA